MKVTKVLIISFFCVLMICDLFSCDDSSQNSIGNRLQITYTPDRSWAKKIIYAVWIENKTHNYFKPIYLCQNLFNTGMASINALPYWRRNKMTYMDKDDIDTVTGATLEPANTNSFTLNTDPISEKQFTLYFEIDHSSDSNTWFSDQPAIIYAANINLNDTSTKTYELTSTGWCPINDITIDSVLRPGGDLQTDFKYINETTNAGEYPASDLVKFIQVSIIK